MKFQGAVIREQNVTFAIVIVKKHVVDSRPRADEAIVSFQPMFPGLPVFLMAQDHRGLPTYYGRDDICRYLSRVPVTAIPWQEYTVS